MTYKFEPVTFLGGPNDGETGLEPEGANEITDLSELTFYTDQPGRNTVHRGRYVRNSEKPTQFVWEQWPHDA